jgi:hypothetical protein
MIEPETPVPTPKMVPGGNGLKTPEGIPSCPNGAFPGVAHWNPVDISGVSCSRVENVPPWKPIMTS